MFVPGGPFLRFFGCGWYRFARSREPPYSNKPKICHPERSGSRLLRTTQSKDLRLSLNLESTKAKGRILSRDFAPCLPIFRRPGSDSRITTDLPYRARTLLASRDPRFPYMPLPHFRCKSLSFHLPCVQSPGHLVGFRCRFPSVVLVSLSFWRIAPPVK